MSADENKMQYMDLGKYMRKDFPIYGRHHGASPFCYLDSAATSLKPQVVIDAVKGYYEEYSTNVHRASYALAERATEKYEAVRATVATFIGAPRPEEIIFTRNTTESFNLLARTYAEHFIREGEGILLTEMEHHANLIPWQELAKRKAVRLHFLPFDTATGTLIWEPEHFVRFLKERSIKLISLTHASNALGTINPIAKIARLAHEAGVIVAVDGAQSIPHLPVNVQELGADFFAFSSHKMLGPTGIGVLWGRYELLEKMPVYMVGGHIIDEVFLDRATYLPPPLKFEAGTPHVAGVIGFGAAVKYLMDAGMERVREHEKILLRAAREALGRIPGISFLGPEDAEDRSGVLAFTVAGLHPHDIGSLCSEAGVMIRVGDHCARPLHKKLGIPASCRASFSVYNDLDEIEMLADVIAGVSKKFGVMPAALLHDAVSHGNH